VGRNGKKETRGNREGKLENQGKTRRKNENVVVGYQSLTELDIS